MSGLRVMVRRQLRTDRTTVVVMAFLWAANNVAQATAYSSIFPDAGTRAATLGTFTSNGALRALYGYPYDISTPTGWLAWRSMGFVVIVMAMWAAFVTAGALRGEETAGRGELALSQPQSRRIWLGAALTAVLIETLVIGAVNVAGLSAFCVPQGLMTIGEAMKVGLQLVVPALLFAAVAAVASQLCSTTRGARIAVAAVLVVAFCGRAAADAGTGIAWLRWVTPLGWFEELQPASVPSVAALLAAAVTTAVLIVAAHSMLAVRDIGTGLLPGRESRPPRRFLLRSPWQAALRDELPQLALWAAGTVVVMALMGSLTKTLLDLVTSNAAFSNLMGRGFAVNAFVAAIFALVQLTATLLVVTMIVAARGEEASGRLDLILAAPMARTRWLLSRVILASVAAGVLAMLSAAALWVGAAVIGQDVGKWSLFEAAVNCVPLIVIAAGLATMVLALAPRMTGFVYAPVALAFLWDALGTAFRAPAWTLDLSPFHWLATVPAQDFALPPAATLAFLGVALVAIGAGVFGHRDLVTG